MLEPIPHQDRFAVCAFDQILQRLQLPVVDAMHIMLRVINSTVGHLQQFICQRRRVHGVNLFTAQGYDHLFPKLIVKSPFLIGQLYFHLVIDAGRHVQKIRSRHGDGDIRDGIVNLFLRSRPEFVREHHLRVPLVRQEISVPVPADIPAQPFTAIQHFELSEQIHEPVAGRGSGQTDYP